MEYNNVNRSICYHGDPNTWGKREAIVACQQLGFKGGWPLNERQEQISSDLCLNNFDCDGCK